MTKDELNSMFQENVNRSSEAPPELFETLQNINRMAYKLCGTMMINCVNSPELMTAIRRVHEGSLRFHDALVQAANHETQEAGVQ